MCYSKLFNISLGMSTSTQSMWGSTWLPTVQLQWAASQGHRVNHFLHRYRHCSIDLFTGEESGFCCELGESQLNDVPALPPLPAEYNLFLSHCHFLQLSCQLNLIFSFTALETTAKFPTVHSEQGFLAIQSKVYHHVRASHQNSTIK